MIFAVIKNNNRILRSHRRYFKIRFIMEKYLFLIHLLLEEVIQYFMKIQESPLILIQKLNYFHTVDF